jgi:hypothetical protein
VTGTRAPGLVRDPLTAILAVAGVACVVVALLVGSGVAGAVVGSCVVLVLYLLEAAAARRGAREDSFARAMLIGVGGMALRLLVAIGVLVAVGLLWRSQFAAAALSLAAVYTVYLFGRLWRHPAVPAGDR